MTATGCGWKKPKPMMAKIPTMNSSVGPISTFADSAMPIRLITKSTASPASVSASK